MRVAFFFFFPSLYREAGFKDPSGSEEGVNEAESCGVTGPGGASGQRRAQGGQHPVRRGHGLVARCCVRPRAALKGAMFPACISAVCGQRAVPSHAPSLPMEKMDLPIFAPSRSPRPRAGPARLPGRLPAVPGPRRAQREELRPDVRFRSPLVVRSRSRAPAPRFPLRRRRSPLRSGLRAPPACRRAGRQRGAHTRDARTRGAHAGCARSPAAFGPCRVTAGRSRPDTNPSPRCNYLPYH